MFNHLMLDLETIGTRPGSIVTSIGAVFFNPYEDYTNSFPDNIPLFYRNINIDSCLKVDLKPDGDSLLWWMQQGEEAVNALTDPEPVGILNAVNDFRNFYWKNKNKLANGAHIHIWAHGLTFDPPIWSEACRAVGQKEPWLYRNCRDTRTLFDLAFGDKNPSFEGFGTKHNALHDALTQIIWVQEAYRTLKN